MSNIHRFSVSSFTLGFINEWKFQEWNINKIHDCLQREEEYTVKPVYNDHLMGYFHAF